MRMNAIRLGALVAILGLSSAADARSKYRYISCVDDEGQMYQTSESSCPDSMSEVKKKAVSCKLKDGSRGFGDKCANPDQVTGELDQRQLSERNAGLSNIDRYGSQRLVVQGQMRQAAAEWRRYQAEQENAADDWQRMRLEALRERREERERRRYVEDYNDE